MLQVGSTPIPGYRIEKFLGRGNFGEVWQAASPGGTKSALKFLNMREQQGRKEFRAIQRLKLVRHALLMPINAMWLLDSEGNVLPDEMEFVQPLMEDTIRRTMLQGASESKPAMLVMAMPLAERNLGEVLKQRHQNGEAGLPVVELLSYMMDAAKAIDFLNTARHDLGSGPIAIQHGDVKPENLVLMGESIVLCDFGVARTMGAAKDTRGTTLGGSLAYMAPECLKGDSASSSDQFSLAITYAELRTGHLPFSESSVTQVIEDRGKGRFDFSDIPLAEQSVLRRALQLDPARRFPSAVAMIEALQSAVQGTPKKSFPWLTASAGAIVMTAIAVGILMLLPKQENPIANPQDPSITSIPDQDLWRTYFKEFSDQTRNHYPLAVDGEQYKKAMTALKDTVASGWTPKFGDPKVLVVDVAKLPNRADRGKARFFTLSPNNNWVATISIDNSKIELRNSEEIDQLIAQNEFPGGHLIRFDWLGNDRIVAIVDSKESQHELHFIDLRKDVAGKPQFTATRQIPLNGIFRDIAIPPSNEYAVVRLVPDAGDSSDKLMLFTSAGEPIAVPPAIIASENDAKKLKNDFKELKLDEAKFVTDDRIVAILFKDDSVDQIGEHRNDQDVYLLSSGDPAQNRKIPLSIQAKTLLISKLDNSAVLFVAGKPLDNKSVGSVYELPIHQLSIKPKVIDAGDPPDDNRTAIVLAHSNQREQPQRLAAAYDDGTLRGWERTTTSTWSDKKEAQLQSFDPDYTPLLCYSLDGKWIAIAYSDSSSHQFAIDLWDPSNGKLTRMTEKADEIVQLHFTRRHLLAASKNGSIKAWDLGKIQLLLDFAVENDKVIKPDEPQPKDSTVGG